jgi:hypothetical protein
MQELPITGVQRTPKERGQAAAAPLVNQARFGRNGAIIEKESRRSSATAEPHRYATRKGTNEREDTVECSGRRSGPEKR